MTDHYFVLSENVLGLHSNTETIKFSYGIHPPAVSRAEYDRCAVRLRLHVGEVELERHDEAHNPVMPYHHFFGQMNQDVLNYHRTFLFRTQLSLKAKGFVGKTPTLNANPTYFRFIPQRFMNLHSVAYMLTDMAGYFLLRHGY